jgi:hypothetical protein
MTDTYRCLAPLSCPLNGPAAPFRPACLPVTKFLFDTMFAVDALRLHCCSYEFKERTRKTLGFLVIGGLAVVGFMIFGGYSVDSAQAKAVVDLKDAIAHVNGWSDGTVGVIKLALNVTANLTVVGNAVMDRVNALPKNVSSNIENFDNITQAIVDMGEVCETILHAPYLLVCQGNI